MQLIPLILQILYSWVFFIMYCIVSYCVLCLYLICYLYTNVSTKVTRNKYIYIRSILILGHNVLDMVQRLIQSQDLSTFQATVFQTSSSVLSTISRSINILSHSVPDFVQRFILCLKVHPHSSHRLTFSGKQFGSQKKNIVDEILYRRDIVVQKVCFSC